VSISLPICERYLNAAFPPIGTTIIGAQRKQLPPESSLPVTLSNTRHSSTCLSSHLTMSKPHIILVPGAWHAPFYMDTMVSKIQSLGYAVHARQMPAVGSSSPPKDLTTDISALRSTVEEAIDTGNDVVVICHSWGGMVTGSGLTGLSKQEREAEGKRGGVVRTGYMAAFIVDIGVSLMDVLSGKAPVWAEIKVSSSLHSQSHLKQLVVSGLTFGQGDYIYATDPNIFYNDLPISEQQDWHAKLQSQSYATFWAKATAATWKTIPTSYLLCEDDLAIPAAGQQHMIDGAMGAGGEIVVTRIKASHSPFLSKIDETVEWIVGVCEAGSK
jgi:pimeloyl-ACP methyl ester carboxylesterase